MKFAPGAWRYAIVPLLVAPFAFIFSTLTSVIALATGAFVLLFFRDPERTPPPTGVVSPADGKVSVLREEGDRVRLGVFMNVWNVHVVRAPTGGTVADVEHTPGANRPAFSKDSDRNERVHVRFADGLEVEGSDSVEDESGAELENEERDARNWDHEVTLVAGAFARRIHPYVEPDDELERGDKLGHIAFGSRVDVVFPPSVDREDVAVTIGEKVTAGETIVLESPRGSSAGFDADGTTVLDGDGTGLSSSNSNSRSTSTSTGDESDTDRRPT